jgi:hypothetical protein
MFYPADLDVLSRGIHGTKEVLEVNEVVARD